MPVISRGRRKKLPPNHPFSGVRIFPASQFPEAWKKKIREQREAKLNSQKSMTHEQFEQEQDSSFQKQIDKEAEEQFSSPTGDESKGSKS